MKKPGTVLRVSRTGRRRAILALLATPMMAASHPSPSQAAEAYPVRPIRVIVPFPAGQGADILMRLLGERLAVELGQPFVVENKPGAGGVVGTAAASKTSADGYTLYMGSSGPLGISPNVYKSVGYDPVKDFAPISNIASVTQVLVTGQDSPFGTLQALIDAAKKDRGAIPFASPGKGSTSHMTMELLSQMSDISMLHVPYKGSPPALVDIIGGRVAVMFDAIPGVLSNVKAGKLRALAVSSARRSPFLPDVPTAAESGIAGFETTGWIGLLAPAGTAPDIIERLHAAVIRVMREETTVRRMQELAFTPIGDTPSQFATFIRNEAAMWQKVARTAGVQID